VLALGVRAPHIEDMTMTMTTLERAFDLAKSGEYESVTEIRAKLKAEGYTLSQLEGPSLNRQLRDLCKASRPVAEDQ
jgi:hypothetical protein